MLNNSTGTLENKRFITDYGGKGSKLVFLKENGFPVPSFAVIPSRVIQRELRIYDSTITSFLAEINPDNDESIIRASIGIEKLLLEHEFSSRFKDAFNHLLQNRFPIDTLFSVRSSALTEDSNEDSYAGILESFLFVERNDLWVNIKKCLASFYNARALKYKILKGYKHAGSEMAIIIQEMVDSAKAGVLFTMNPEGNHNHSMIVAGYGQGEGIVKDRIETDHFFVDRQNQLIRKVINKKSTFLSAKSEDNFKLREFKLSASQTEKAVLSNQEILKIFQIGEQLEDKLGAPQDIEFAIDKSSTIHILQTRNITTIDYSDIKILDNSNIVESYPGITLPLSFSFARSGYQNVFARTLKTFELTGNNVERTNVRLSRLIEHVNGRVYYNLHHWYHIIQKIITSDKSLKAWERLIGIRTNKKRHVSANLKKRMHLFLVVARLMITYSRLTRKFFREFEVDYTGMRNFIEQSKNKEVTPKEWYLFYEEISEKLFRKWVPTLVNDFFTFKFYDYLNRMVLSYGFDEDENITNDLLCGMEDVESESLVLAFLSLKDEVNSDPELRQLFLDKPGNVIKNLNDPRYSYFHKKFYNFIEAYGDRTTEELKMETENLRMNPERLVSRIKSHLKSKNSAHSFKENQIKIRQSAEKKIRSHQLPLSPKSILYKFVLQCTRIAIRNRENMRFCRTRGYGIVKEIFSRIGVQLDNDKIIEAPKDVFYLELDQLRVYCLKGRKSSLVKFINDQKLKYKSFEKQSLPGRIIYTGETIPIPMNLDEELIEIEGTLKGIGISKGIVTGKAVVIDNPETDEDLSNKILVAQMTDPAWIFLMSRAKGLISEKGSALSHTAIIGRELGIPTVVGVDHATKLVKTGNSIQLNGSTGKVTLLDRD